jgi:hypothetical protein
LVAAAVAAVRREAKVSACCSAWMVNVRAVIAVATVAGSRCGKSECARASLGAPWWRRRRWAAWWATARAWRAGSAVAG